MAAIFKSPLGGFRVLLLLILLPILSTAQTNNVGIGIATPDLSAILDLTSDHMGFLAPRMDSVHRLAISAPASGLLVFDTDYGCFYYYRGGWNSLCTLAAGGGTIGPTGPTGAPGPAGANGTNGIAGSTGQPGTIGNTGATGPTGIGTIGPTGPMGTDTTQAWLLLGNTGTVDGVNFLGTIDNVPLTFRTNNQQSGRIETNINTGNTAFGYQALMANTSLSNCAFGYQALDSNATGEANTAVGYLALNDNTSGSGNTAMGTFALQYSTGSSNTAIGLHCLTGNTSGSNNTAIGAGALEPNTIGSNNVAVGFIAMAFNSSGNGNTAIGDSSLFNLSGSYNTAGGLYAQAGLNSDSNTSFGAFTMHTGAAGGSNTVLGFGADAQGGNTHNSTAIGANAQVTASNCLVLGSGANVGIGVSAPSHLLQLAADDAAKPGTNTWIIASDERLKTGIRPYMEGLSLLTRVRPVWFRYTGEAGMPTRKEYVGILAQDIQKIAPYMVGTWVYQDTSGAKHDYLSYDGNSMTYILINSVKEQQQMIEHLNNVVNTLMNEIDALKKERSAPAR